MISRIEQLEQENQALKALVASLVAKVEELTSEIAELKARLNKNSNNSNKPPSSDGPKKTVKNSRVKSNKPSGGQPGHKGATKSLTHQPDTIVELIPQTECDCGGEVVVQTDSYTIRQRTDLVPLRVITAEYRAHDGICDTCGKTHKASFPEEVSATNSYGEHIQAILTYLNTYQLLPLQRSTELMKDLFGVKISQGTIVNSNNEANEELAEPEERTKWEIIQSDIGQFDESGMRVGGTNYWLHTASTKTSTVYMIHQKRGKEAMDEMGILPQFRGTAIHDHWKSYYTYLLCAHAECNQHILRTLKYLFEDLKQDWAGEMVCLLLRIKRHVDLTKLFNEDETSLAQEDIIIYEGMYRQILENEESRKAQASLDARRLLNRLAKFEQETLLFMYDFDVPFTNNLAERDIRMPKVKQKISGGFRSEEGANAFARVRGFISTTKKRGKSVYDGLVAVFKGEAMDFLYPQHEPDRT